MERNTNPNVVQVDAALFLDLLKHLQKSPETARAIDPLVKHAKKFNAHVPHLRREAAHQSMQEWRALTARTRMLCKEYTNKTVFVKITEGHYVAVTLLGRRTDYSGEVVVLKRNDAKRSYNVSEIILPCDVPADCVPIVMDGMWKDARVRANLLVEPENT